MTIEEASKPYVLVIDNDESWRKKLSDFCLQAGCRVDVLADLDQGIVASDNCAYDVIITEYSFPRLPIDNLLANSRNTKNPHSIIFISEKYSVDEATRVLNNGACDFLQKPLDYLTFERSIHKAFNNQQKTKCNHLLNKNLIAAKYQYEFKTTDVGDNVFPMEALEQMRKSGLIDKELYLKLQLVLQEAFTNSVEHGNLDLKSSWKDEFDSKGIDLFSKIKRERLINPIYAERKINLTLCFDQDKLVFTVKDQGQGFLENKKVSIKKNDDLKPYGRGLIIILKVMDEVNYSHKGSEVELIKYLKEETNGVEV
jgi:DNA-binding response OmpR family regulator